MRGFPRNMVDFKRASSGVGQLEMYLGYIIILISV